jgi:hypothetical protein
MIIRSEKNKNYTVISNIGLNDDRLSLKARGMYAYLLSKPDAWKITDRGLEGVLKESRPTIGAVLRELEECGYLSRQRFSAGGGKFKWEATLYEKPMDKKLDHGDNTLEKNSSSGPTMDKKTMDGKLVHIVNTDKVNTITTEMQEQTLKLHLGYVKLFKLDASDYSYSDPTQKREMLDKAAKLYRLTDKRRAKAAARLKDAGYEMCKKAIVNAAKDPWMHGENDRGWKMDLYDYLFRSYEEVEKWATK